MVATARGDAQLRTVTQSHPPLPDTVEWRVSAGLTPYAAALAEMEARAAAVTDGSAGELVWLLEHPPVYTAGTSADPVDLIDARFPVIATGRGGKYTYHGPGQRIGYVVFDLTKRGRDVRHYVHTLEAWVIAALGEIGVEAFAIPGRVGIWTLDHRNFGGREAKIGAIGVRVRRWVTLHGFAVNVAPDLSHFGGIVPCGLPDPVTSLKALGISTNLATFDAALALTAGAFAETLSLASENGA
ncbi:lipoyl(octanoyl) transferase LipB [Sphingomonas ginsenosidivorax]|uniref:Octanoyltransferase n=1 Tax=Sphingomonas ginsenosidivorax TaxID=862135 RepID=A0A5C6UKH0_9SPHN|nr:lipoyl(octanoyl) transferase LipB [Sphingomonas ginsenosidivorax]